MRHQPPRRPAAPAAVGLVAVIITVATLILFIWSTNDLEEWEQWCHAQGGHIDRTSELAGGGRNTWVNYTNYCLTSDGRIIDIKE